MTFDKKMIARALRVALLVGITFSVGGTVLANGPKDGSLDQRTDKPPSLLTFHTFDIEEVFSNADGSVQFIELQEADGLQGQFHFTGNQVVTNANVLTYPNDLPGTVTAHRFVLIATAGFAALPGGITPDFVIPQRFVNISGDMISILDVTTSVPVDSFSFGLTVPLPTDGLLSLNRDLTTGINSPTNFAGETGSVRLNASVPTLSSWGLIVTAGLLLVAGSWVIGWRRLRPSKLAGCPLHPHG